MLLAAGIAFFLDAVILLVFGGKQCGFPKVVDDLFNYDIRLIMPYDRIVIFAISSFFGGLGDVFGPMLGTLVLYVGRDLLFELGKYQMLIYSTILISSFTPTTSGEVLYRGERISNLKPHIVARKGVVRWFQETTILKSMTVHESVVVAQHLRAKASRAGHCHRPGNGPQGAAGRAVCRHEPR